MWVLCGDPSHQTGRAVETVRTAERVAGVCGSRENERAESAVRAALAVRGAPAVRAVSRRLDGRPRRTLRPPSDNMLVIKINLPSIDRVCVTIQATWRRFCPIDRAMRHKHVFIFDHGAFLYTVRKPFSSGFCSYVYSPPACFCTERSSEEEKTVGK